jgi:hypothetical protein
MTPFRPMRLLTVAFAAIAAACSSDGSTAPTAPDPVLGLSATAVGSDKVHISFSGRAGESYTIERAEGAGGAFATAGAIASVATDGTQSYDDAALKVATLYRYRVISTRGGVSSSPSTEVTATTFALGFASAEITGDITTNRTLYRDTTYTLKGFIHVANGATLTIQSGTTIKGDFNTLGSSLWILRGAKIDAQGTADQPIVFTSSRAAGQRQIGDWGGLLIIGNGIDNRSGSVEIEGSGTDGTTVASGKNYQVIYSGGTTPTDNSGTMSYVRVEFAGFAPSLNNELNAFTFAAVGSGTRVSYVQALATLDDAFEFFGGALDGDHLVAYEVGDDMFDMSEGFSGRLQYLIGFSSTQLTPRTGAGFLATDLEGIENDGCAGSGCDNGFDTQPFTSPLVANFTLIGCGNANCVGASGGHGMMLRRGTAGFYVNGVVARWPADGVSLRDANTFARAGSALIPDLATADLQVRNVHFAETPAIFQAASATQFALDAAGNSLTLGGSTAAALFTKLPATGTTPAAASDFDWTPATGAAIATGGMATFSGKIATKAGTFVTATSYLGAAQPGGTKWWSGWTNYARN